MNKINLQEKKEDLINFLKERPKSFYFLLGFLLLILIGTVDSLTGPEIALSVFYLIPIFITAFYIGLRAGLLISVACVISYLLADRAVEISYSKTATPYWNSAARLFLYVMVAYFLAKRKMAEQKLSESEERFRLLVNGVRDYAIIMLDPKGRIISWNPGAERAFGYLNHEILGKHYSFFYAPSSLVFQSDYVLEAASTNKVTAYEGWCLRKNDSRFWADIVITPLHDKNERLRGFSMLTRDMTERKKAEETVHIYAELHQIDRAILVADSSEGLANEALIRIEKLIPFNRAIILLLNSDLDQATILALKSNERLECQTGEIFLIDPEIAKDFEQLKEGKILSFQDPNQFSDSSLLFNTLYSRESTPSTFIPLLSHEKLIGALILSIGHRDDLTTDQLKIAGEVADQVAVALHNTLLYEQLREAHLQLQTLSHCLIQVQETERRHLARELHDEMGQALTAVKIHLQETEGLSDDPGVLENIQESIAIVEKMVHQVRSLSIDLRPLLLDDLGLVATLRWYVSRQSQLGGFISHFNANPEKMFLSTEVETACFRVAQEAITNIVRHAKAKKIHVEIKQTDQELLLLVRDDGIGFDIETVQKRSSQTLSMGLLGMKERVTLLEGSLEIESVLGYGTEIRVCLPLKNITAERVR